MKKLTSLFIIFILSVPALGQYGDEYDFPSDAVYHSTEGGNFSGEEQAPLYTWGWRDKYSKLCSEIEEAHAKQVGYRDYIVRLKLSRQTLIENFCSQEGAPTDTQVQKLCMDFGPLPDDASLSGSIPKITDPNDPLEVKVNAGKQMIYYQAIYGRFRDLLGCSNTAEGI